MKYNKQAKNLIAKKVTTSLTNKKGLLQINFYEFLNEQDHSNTKGLGWFHAPNNIKIVSEIETFITEKDINKFSVNYFVISTLKDCLAG